MKVVVEVPPRREHSLPKKIKVKALLEELRLNPESVIVIRGKELLTPDDWVGEEDEIRIRGVISGG